MSDTFIKGDFIQVIPKKEDYGVIRGAALHTRGLGGPAAFAVQLPDGQVLNFNLNEVNVTNLFRAQVARAMDRNDSEWSRKE